MPDNCAAAYKAQSWWINTWSIVEKTVSVAEVSNDSDVILMPGARSVEIVSSTDKIINIYNIKGHLVDSVAVKAGQQTTIPLQHGVYIINKSKIYIN